MFVRRAISAFGGEQSPREAGDPTANVVESEAFWRDQR